MNKPITREEFPALVSFLDGDSSDPVTALREVYDTILAQGVAMGIEAAAHVLEYGADREVAVSWNKDGTPSKHDRCSHGQWRYEDCEQCTLHAIRKLDAVKISKGE